MITVTYNRKKHTLTCRGHAQSGEAGHDLICAAASILIYTLGTNVDFAKNSGYAKSARIHLEPGNAEIRCKAFSRYSHKIGAIFSEICVGFELLARDYPKNIEYKLI